MPRAGLSREVVVAEAARLADEVGHDRVTLAAVAQRFGVAVPSLYKHVHGLGALRRDLAVVAMRELSEALATAVDGDRARDHGLHALANAYRAYARSRPGRYAAALRAPDPDDPDAGPVSRSVLDTVLSVLAGYGLTGDDAIDAARAARSALHGFVSLEAVGGFGMPQDVDRSYERLVDLLETALRNWRPVPPAAATRSRPARGGPGAGPR